MKHVLLTAALLALPSVAFAEAIVDDNTVTFRLDTNEWETKPTSVNVAGEFNGWNGGATEMTDADGDGVYEATVELQDGRVCL